MMGFVFDDPDATLQEIIDEILSLPPERRFSNSTEVLKRRIEEEFGDLETARAAVPGIDEPRIVERLISHLNHLIESTLENVLRTREAEQPLVLAAGYAAVLSGYLELRDGRLTAGEKKQLESATLAFFARAVSQPNDPDEGREALIRDVGYTLYYVEDAIADRPDVPDPSDRSLEDVLAFVREYGATLAYARLDISVGRGAELAGTSQFEFEEVLEKYDVEPRRGPSSISELYDDGVGIEDD